MIADRYIAMTQRLGLLGLTVVMVGYGQQAAPIDFDAEAASGCDTIQSALRIGDLEYAFLAAVGLARAMGSTKPLPPAEARVTGDVRDAAADACGQIAAAFAANDPAKARQVTANLFLVLTQAVSALPSTPQAKFARLEAVVSHLEGLNKFYRLAAVAKAAFDAGEIDKAAVYAHEMLDTAPQYPTDWNYGNAIYFGNWVLGRAALRKGNATQAGQYLLDAASTPGSPQLNSFGPNTRLAQELLEKGQTEVVLQYFTLCANFWKMDYGQLADWTAVVKGGGVPKFGATLLY